MKEFVVHVICVEGNPNFRFHLFGSVTVWGNKYFLQVFLSVVFLL